MTRPSICVVLLIFISTARAAELRVVDLEITGGEQKTPLSGLHVTIIERKSSPYPEVAKGKTNEKGELQLKLAPGRYQALLTSDVELKYLPIARGYVWYELGYKLIFDVKDQAEPLQVSYSLVEGCELSLRVVDEQTGEGLAGACFYTFYDAAEMWCEPIDGDNLGAKPVPNRDLLQVKTGKDGTLKWLKAPCEGYGYGVWKSPDGYELVGPRDVELDTSIDKKQAEKVFKFRRKK